MAARQWERFGIAAVAAVQAALEADGHSVARAQITPGRPAWICEGATVAAWIDSLDDTRGDPNCLDTPKLTWFLQVGICGAEDEAGATSWHSGLQAAWCALSAWIRSAPIELEWGAVRLGFTRTNQRAANETAIDFTLIVEEGCEQNGSEDE